MSRDDRLGWQTIITPMMLGGDHFLFQTGDPIGERTIGITLTKNGLLDHCHTPVDTSNRLVGKSVAPAVVAAPPLHPAGTARAELANAINPCLCALRQDFLNATTVSAQKILHAEEAKISSDDPVTHALTHMTVEWAIKYSNNHGGEVVGPYELSDDRRKSVDAYTNFMGDSYEQTDQSLIKTRSWSNCMREFPEDITNSQLQG